MMIVSALLLLLVIESGVGKPCSQDTSVDITDGERFDNDTIEYNGMLYPSDKYYVASDNQTRGCICKIAKCYRKCCARDEIYHENSANCVNASSIELSDEDKETMYKYFEEFQKLEDEHDLRQVNGFNELNGCDNDSCLFRTDSYKSHRLTEEGILVVGSVEVSDQIIDVDRYCIDVMYYYNEKADKTKIGREAYFRGEIFHAVEEYAQNYIAMLISAVFILLTIAVHLILPEMKKSLHGQNLLCHLCSMLVSFVSIAAMQMSITFNDPTRNVCMAFSFVIYFSLLAAFFWLNVMCFDMWRKFRFTRAIVSGDLQRRFRRYCMYAFGVPFLLTALLATLEFAPIEDHMLLPRMRKRECFLSGKGKLIYLYMPITYVCITNMVLFVLTTMHIVKTSKNTKRHLSSEDSKNSKAKDKQRLLTYIKLFVVMGLTWILEVVSFIFPQADILWKITDAFNALGGLFVFIIVVCTREKIHALKNRFRDIFNIRDKMGSTITLSTDLSQNISKSSDNLEQGRKNIHQGTKESETKQNSNTNYSNETSNVSGQTNGMKEKLDEKSYSSLKDEETKENAVAKEVRSSETFDNIVSEMEIHNKEESENENKMNILAPCNKERDTGTEEEHLDSNETHNNIQENDNDLLNEHMIVNQSNTEERYPETIQTSKTIDTREVNEEETLQKNEKSNKADINNKCQNEFETENDEKDLHKRLQQDSDSVKSNHEENTSGTPVNLNKNQENKEEVSKSSSDVSSFKEDNENNHLDKNKKV